MTNKTTRLALALALVHVDFAADVPANTLDLSHEPEPAA